MSTAIGIGLLLAKRKPWPIRLMGLVGLILPHAVGAPVAMGQSFVPAQLVPEFALASILTTGIFWSALGSIGGLIYGRSGNTNPISAPTRTLFTYQVPDFTGLPLSADQIGSLPRNTCHIRTSDVMQTAVLPSTNELPRCPTAILFGMGTLLTINVCRGR